MTLLQRSTTTLRHVICLTFGLTLFYNAHALADDANALDEMRLRTVRVVPQSELSDWSPRQVSVGIDSTAFLVTEQKQFVFARKFQRFLRGGLSEQGFTFATRANTQIKVTIDTLDQEGSKAQAIGGLPRRGVVFGTVKVIESGEVAGSYLFSSRIRSLSGTQPFGKLAARTASRLVDKLVRGIRDDSLHSYRNQSLKSS